MRECSSSRGGWLWSFGQWHCVRAPQLVRGFETLTQWLNLLGSNLILEWFSSETPASSDFSNILYSCLFLEPMTETLHRGPQTRSHIRVHTNSCSRTQMLYISAFWKSCVYTRLTGRFLCPKHYYKHIHWEQSGRGRKLQFQLSKMLVLRVGDGLFLRWCAQWSLYSPVICSVTHMRSPTYDSTQDNCLERSIYALFPRWRHSGCKPSNISFCVHKTLCWIREATSKLPIHWGICKKEQFHF